ncbi:M18 family aminopeptidase [Anaerostipes sp.]|uniref:M18 family aminopeptidase n=1 Tax=Anaerostipes sp. TaxID=1872530 RepID=UPI0025BCE6EF|nr:M18 family aminopeptidase [Anaerostipes sp.]MBS7009617.1 M18 family aminopeptidase [Anaerostipes sp.]
MSEQINTQLFKFIEKSPCSYHVVQQIGRELAENGFLELEESKAWKIEEGGKYFIRRNGSSVIAFCVPDKGFKGFHITASHTDSPSFKIKENAEIQAENHYTKLNTEKYGGMLMDSWLDRPLSVAGKLVVKEGEGLKEILVHIDRDLLMIPRLAIHMKRGAEDETLNAQIHMLPLFGDGNAGNAFLTEIASAANVEIQDILGTDLYLYNRMPGTVWGAKGEYLSAPRLDDLQCVFASLQAFVNSEGREYMNVYCAFDNEEVGSGTKQGAGSTFLKDILRRVNEALGRNEEQYRMAAAESFMISADNAHAVHPNQPAKADLTNRPYMNEGIVIKYSANQKYTTDAYSGALMKHICEKAEVPYQTFHNRSDLPGGSTLGNILTGQVSLRAADIGLAQLAMHSAYETAGTKDTEYMIRALQEFYRS